MGGGLCNDDGGVCIITEGKIINNIANDLGGGLYLDGATTLTSVEISNNNANYGAGIAFSGGNNKRVVNINTGTKISNNNANYYGGGLYMQMGDLNMNGGEIYNNKINKLNGLSASNHSDLFLIENGQIYINNVKLSGSIFKSDSSNIYLKSNLIKYNDESNIYLDFLNNGNNKTLLTGSNYEINTDDLNNINLIDSNLGSLALDSELNGNSIIFYPKILTVSFSIFESKKSFLSLLEEYDEEKQEEIYYYGKEIILSQNLFPIKENEYVSRLYDDKGNNYEIGQTLKLLDNIQFLYNKGYKNKIVFDFIDYQEQKLLIPNEIIYLPSFRSDYSIEKIILFWKDEITGDIYKKYQKIQGDKNRTLVAIYNGEYYPVKILFFNNTQISKIIKFGEDIIFPVDNIPSDIHFNGWIDQFNKKYDKNIKTISIEKEYSFKGIYITYVNYYINDELIYQKVYDYNSSFTLLNNNEFQNKHILGWRDKNNNEYYSNKEYNIQKDIDLYAILEEKNTIVIIIIIIVAILLLCIGTVLVFRYIRRKNNLEKLNKIEEIFKNDKSESENLQILNDK